jgi:uncharacterized protein (DUF58 family)
MSAVVTARTRARAWPVRTRALPGRRLPLYALLALCAYPFGAPGLLAGALYTALLMLCALYEARALRRALPEVERKLDARLLVGVENRVAIRLYNASDRPLQVSVRDDAPDSFAIDDGAEKELATLLQPHARTELCYQAVPSGRGNHAFGQLHLRLEGRFGLGALIASVPAAQDVRVYPNLRGPRRYELATRLHALHSVGVRSMRRPGGGGEFEQLREYVAGDSYRDLDWKATAKRRRPITRVQGHEVSQSVVIALDVGHMMAAELESLTKLDHAIHAALLLAYVALRRGDKVGLVLFAHEVLEFLPPRSGHAQYGRILESLAVAQAHPTYVDFRRLAEFVRARLPRRALLVMFSDLLDETQAVPLAESAKLLRQRHLPLCVSMKDTQAERLAHSAAANAEGAYRRAAAAAVLEDRATIKLHLRKSGVGILEAGAGELAVATVNRYLEIKSRHAL